MVDRPNMKLMPDIFHMNIEDVTIGGELAKNIDQVAYIHLADSNRLAPGWGHTDFEDLFGHLKNVIIQDGCRLKYYQNLNLTKRPNKQLIF